MESVNRSVSASPTRRAIATAASASSTGGRGVGLGLALGRELDHAAGAQGPVAGRERGQRLLEQGDERDVANRGREFVGATERRAREQLPVAEAGAPARRCAGSPACRARPRRRGCGRSPRPSSASASRRSSPPAVLEQIDRPCQQRHGVLEGQHVHGLSGGAHRRVGRLGRRDQRQRVQQVVGQLGQRRVPPPAQVRGRGPVPAGAAVGVEVLIQPFAQQHVGEAPAPRPALQRLDDPGVRRRRRPRPPPPPPAPRAAPPPARSRTRGRARPPLPGRAARAASAATGARAPPRGSLRAAGPRRRRPAGAARAGTGGCLRSAGGWRRSDPRSAAHR